MPINGILHKQIFSQLFAISQKYDYRPKYLLLSKFINFIDYKSIAFCILFLKMDQVLQQNQTQFNRVCEKMKRLLIKKQKIKSQHPCQIIDGLFVGNYASAINKKFLQSNSISLVVSCLKIDDKDKLSDVEYVQMIIKDKPQQRICQHFQKFIALVNSNINGNHNKKCLVNCFSGKSRSCTLALSYLINKKKITYEQAIKELKQKYPNAQPNSGFVLQLKQYAEQIKNKVQVQVQVQVQQAIQILKTQKPIQEAQKQQILCISSKIQQKQVQQKIQQNENHENDKIQEINPAQTTEKNQINQANQSQNNNKKINDLQKQNNENQVKEKEKTQIQNINHQKPQQIKQAAQKQETIEQKKQKISNEQSTQKTNQNEDQLQKQEGKQNNSQKQQQNNISKQSEARKKKKKHKKKK